MDNQSLWSNVDDYLAEQYLRPDPQLDAALAASVAAGLPAINVSPTQGQLLHIYARMLNAKRILEIGTLGGYSTICLARALPADGRLITLEFEANHAAVARENIRNAGLTDRVEIRLGRAIDLLPAIHAEHAGPFDFIFIDADKTSTADYFLWSMRLIRAGGVILVDNVIRKGQVADARSDDTAVQGIQRFNEIARKTPGIRATAMQTVGGKGYDGFAIVFVDHPAQ